MLADEEQVAFAWIDAEGLQAGDHPAAAFGNRRVFKEETLPDEVGLPGFVQGPELFVIHPVITKGFGNQVMIDEQLINSPEQERAKYRIVEVGMDVVNGCLQNNPMNDFLNAA